MNTLHILISGKRNYNDFDYFCRVLEPYRNLNDKIIIVEGGAAGVDNMARKYATIHNLEYKEFLPDWKQYGKAAGPIRNR